ncbi:MAG: hypothetical protein Q4B21_04145 [Bacteroidia bacterium]|nr:hypothetical protein [Bacteroidia bacterium]
MKKLFLSLLFVGWGIMALAQENGLNPIYQIYVNDLKYNVPDKDVTVGRVIGAIAEAATGKICDIRYTEYVPALNAKVKGAFSDVLRVTVLNNQNAQLDYSFTGEITNLATTSTTRLNEYKNSDGKIVRETIIKYETNISVSITMTSANGATRTHNFTGYGISDYLFSTAEKSINMAIGSLSDNITKFFNSQFPITANVIERGTEKKDKQKGLYIDVGSYNKVHRDLHFGVYVVGNVAGRETRKQVGKLIVTEVLGDNISACKVQSGGKEIKLALDEDKNVVAISTK